MVYKPPATQVHCSVGARKDSASIMTSLITYDSRKFEELLLHVAAESVDDPNFGKTKLNKVLYYIDFVAYGTLGSPVTGAMYQRRPYGPVPREITSARAALLARADAVVDVVQRFGHPQERLVAKRNADLSVFSDDELAIIEDVIAALRDKNGSEVSEMSHRELGWKLAGDGDTIPYSTTFLSARSMNADDVRRGQEIYRILEAGVSTLADVAKVSAGVA